ncbi:MAG: hypothetical protein KC910_30830, partial [Candidatus Eremiobacteraeota bacterium]|nr:hypothetical protein [Candidatus Eremiobacteraeota bacterium]
IAEARQRYSRIAMPAMAAVAETPGLVTHRKLAGTLGHFLAGLVGAPVGAITGAVGGLLTGLTVGAVERSQEWSQSWSRGQ